MGKNPLRRVKNPFAKGKPLQEEKIPSPRQKSFANERKHLIQGKIFARLPQNRKKTRSRIDPGSKTIQLKKEKISPEISNLL
jgi:hypothetical protein